ncbi:MAG: spondin domain-containing protein, partial [Holophagales bacterium]|nr:spondin domain-containing protein [Holophagales bacterium]
MRSCQNSNHRPRALRRPSILLLLATLALSAGTAGAVEVRVTVENVAPENGAFITPFWIGFHDGSFDTYDAGAPAADFPGLESLAEDGDTSGVTAEFASQLPGGVQATLPGVNGPIFSGETVTWTGDLDPAA